MTCPINLEKRGRSAALGSTGLRFLLEPNQKPNILLTAVPAALDYQIGGLDDSERPMLPPFIIEQIRKREEEERRRHTQDQPRLELPLDVHRPASPREKEDDAESPDRGVVIVDLLGEN